VRDEMARAYSWVADDVEEEEDKAESQGADREMGRGRAWKKAPVGSNEDEG